MSRSPLFYPLNRGMDAEAGGAADLQTDVMRFMAILSLCLVAIFALVQSIPPEPLVENSPPDEITTEIESVALPVVQSELATVTEIEEAEIQLTRPRPQKPTPHASSVELKRPAPRAAAVQPKRDPLTQIVRPIVQAIVEPDVLSQVAADASPQGFTLRFEDDAALTRLVARNEVGLYAMATNKAFRMQVNRGEISFWPASVPGQFHEMDSATVPSAVRDAFQRSGGPRSASLQWGVTIPAGTARQLDRFLRESSGGSLIIDADGDLRLES